MPTNPVPSQHTVNFLDQVTSQENTSNTVQPGTQPNETPNAFEQSQAPSNRANPYKTVSIPLKLPANTTKLQTVDDLLKSDENSSPGQVTERKRKEFLNCLLAALCVGYKDANGERINNVAQLRQLTGFQAEIEENDGQPALELSNVPAHATEVTHAGFALKPRYQQLIQGVIQSLVIDHHSPTACLKETLANQLPLANANTLAVLRTLMGVGAINGPVICRTDSDEEDNFSLDGINHQSLTFWGGGSIPAEEYDYSAAVSKAIMENMQPQMSGNKNDDKDAHFTAITGSGPGVMKGPMMGLKKSEHPEDLYKCLGLSQTSIIAIEAPNHHIDELVIFPDMEKRLEAFMRTGQGLVVFPGGIGTLEETMYLLSITLHAENKHNSAIPVVFTGPESAKGYYENFIAFLNETIGPEAGHYVQERLILGDPKAAADKALTAISHRDTQRDKDDVADRFDPLFDQHLTIPKISQKPFAPTAENIESLNNFFQKQETDQAEPRKDVIAARVRQLVHVVFRMTLNKRAGMAGMAGIEGAELKLPNSIRQPLQQLLESARQAGRLKVSAEALTEIFEGEPEKIASNAAKNL